MVSMVRDAANRHHVTIFRAWMMSRVHNPQPYALIPEPSEPPHAGMVRAGYEAHGPGLGRWMGQTLHNLGTLMKNYS